MAKAFVGHLSSHALAAASAAAVGLSAFVVLRLDARSGILFSSLICGALLVTLLGKRYLVRKLGGVTGDAIGAMSELVEVFVFFLFVAVPSGN
jgi:cobalamin synthase